MENKVRKPCKYEKQIQALRLIDDDFMKLVFEDNFEAAELLLNVFFDRYDMKVLTLETQHEVKNPNGRSVRFDIYAVDSEGKHYDIEIQRSDRGADEHRARFNSAMLDSRLLESGHDPKEMVDSYVIFITENDVRGKGRPIYRFSRMDEESHELFGDGSHIIYVNGAYRNPSDRIGRLMNDFQCTNADDMHNEVLAKKVKYFKENEGGSENVCKIFEDFWEEKKKEYKIQLIPQMLELGDSVEKIAKLLDLTLEEVQKFSTTAKQ